jgi:hypothetical protein
LIAELVLVIDYSTKHGLPLNVSAETAPKKETTASLKDAQQTITAARQNGKENDDCSLSQGTQRLAQGNRGRICAIPEFTGAVQCR